MPFGFNAASFGPVFNEQLKKKRFDSPFGALGGAPAAARTPGFVPESKQQIPGLPRPGMDEGPARPVAPIEPRPAMPKTMFDLINRDAVSPLDTNQQALAVPKPAFRGPSNPDFVPNLTGRGPVREPYSDIAAARNEWMLERGERDAEGNWTGKFKRRPKDILLNALMGAGQGLAAGGGLGGALGGALAGGVGTAISPRLGAEYSFNQMALPQMEAEQTRLSDQRQRQMKDDLLQAQTEDVKARAADRPADNERRIKEFEARMKDAELDRRLKEKEIEERYKPKAANPKDRYISTPGGLYDVETGQIIPGTTREAAEKPPSMAETERDRELEEGSVDQIARDSTDARRNEIISSLPKEYQEILNGRREPLDAQEQMAAQNAYQQAYDRVYRQNLQYTRGVARQKNQATRTGNRKGPHMPAGAPSGNSSVAPRNVNDLLKFLQ